ncbi:hypothetical protein PJN14_29985, partial [Mycobacterium kansasii]
QDQVRNEKVTHLGANLRSGLLSSFIDVSQQCQQENPEGYHFTERNVHRTTSFKRSAPTQGVYVQSKL